MVRVGIVRMAVNASMSKGTVKLSTANLLACTIL